MSRKAFDATLTAFIQSLHSVEQVEALLSLAEARRAELAQMVHTAATVKCGPRRRKPIWPPWLIKAAENGFGSSTVSAISSKAILDHREGGAQ